MIYRILRAFWRFALRVYFRGIEAEGLDRVPSEGPVLLVANHTNAFVDALLILCLLDRKVTLTAKSTLRSNPLLAFLIRGLGIVELRRRQDEAGDASPERNDEAIESCARVLEAGGVLAIFPEGVSHSDGSIRPFRTGAARIALRAIERRGGDVTIVPVGLCFEAKERLRSDVLIRIGDPFQLGEWVRGEGERDARALTSHMEDAVRSITFNVRRRREELLVDWADTLLSTGPDGPARLDRERVDVMSRFARREQLYQQWTRLRERTSDEVDALVGELRDLRRDLRRRGLEPRELFLPLDPLQAAYFVLREGELIVFGFPIVLVGCLIHGVPWLIVRGLTKKLSTDRDHWASNALFLAVAVWPVLLTAEAALVAWRWGSLWTVLFFVAAFFTSSYTSLWIDRAGAAFRRASCFVRLVISRGEASTLRGRASTLIDKIHQIQEFAKAEGRGPNTEGRGKQ